MNLASGARLGPYEIVGPLGAGGMGEVYRARDPKLGRNVAIKVLNLDAAANAVSVRRFEQEARAASALNHPGIVTIHDTGESDGRFYIVMEMIEGTTLRHLLRRGRPPLKKALQIAGQLADALANAHDAGIVHRDLKPENVMISSEGHLKIVDFGLAKLAEPAAALGPGGDGTVTDGSTHGVLLGTVGYMSPEQASGESADYRSDQFAFGAILYELVTGERAFHRTTSVETLAMIISGEPQPPIAVNPTLPPPVAWTIERCLAKDPPDRYASTRDLAREVHTLRDHTADLLAFATSSPAAARRLPILLGAALAAALVGAGAYFATHSNRAAVAETARPTFKQLTFRRGHVPNARFAPDGQTVFYAAAWGGTPVQVFETRPSRPESRPLGPAAASLASISSTGELALILGCRLDWANCVGTLARMPPGGGAPREVLEQVVSADWTPDGQALAAIQLAEGEYQVQFPLGKPLYTAAGRLAFVRFSPRGDRLAFVEHQLVSDDGGVLKVVDLRGQVATLSRRWDVIRELAWSPAGDEVWVSASERGRSSNIYAVSLSGTQRLVLHAPGALALSDLAQDRRALVTHGLSRAHIIWASGTEERELSWLDWSTVADVSPDGRTILFYEWGQAVAANPVVYLRTVDSSDAVRLGDGKALALSPDGRWALALQEDPKTQLVLLPTGPGGSRSLPAADLTDFYWAKWFPDSRRLLVVAAGADAVPRSYIQHTDTGQLEPIAEKGMLGVLVAPDGRRLLISDPLAGYLVWPLDGGMPVALKDLAPGERPIQWSGDGRFLYVKGPEEAVIRMYRFDLTTGKRELLKELAPPDPSGVVGVATGRGELAVTPDGKSYVFTFWTFVRDLFLVEGLSR
jgi:eukaryotic-like serine/threonine-protein kinase